MGVVSSAAAIAILRDPFAVAASGLAGAAIAAAVRALAPQDPAAIVAAVLSPLLFVVSIAEHGLFAAAPCVAIAAIMWTIALLARPANTPALAVQMHGHDDCLDGTRRHGDTEKSFFGRLRRPETSSPCLRVSVSNTSGTGRAADVAVVMMLPAVVAAVLEPAAIALVPIAATRLATSNRRPWMVAIPFAGGVAVLLAVIAGTAHHGVFASLGAHWFGAAHPIAAHDMPRLLGDAIGPLTGVAALAGIALLAKLRLAELAVISVIAGSLLCDLRSGAIGPTTLAMAALCAALAIGRFARTIRMPNLQAVAGVTVAVMLLVPPAWTVIELMR